MALEQSERCLSPCRSFVAILALVACTSPETDLDRYHDLDHQVVLDCGRVADTNTCGTESAAQQAITCMNDALTSRTRAAWRYTTGDTYGFTYEMAYFAVDGQVQVFQYYPGQSNDSYEPTARAQPTCAGPFELATGVCPYGSGMTSYFLKLDGCP